MRAGDLLARPSKSPDAYCRRSLAVRLVRNQAAWLFPTRSRLDDDTLGALELVEHVVVEEELFLGSDVGEGHLVIG